MWSVASLRIKHNENTFTSNPYDKEFYNMYDGDYLRIGDLYITEKLPKTFDYDEPEFIKFSKKCYLSMGAPYKSTNSEVLDRAIELFYFINYDQTGVRMNLHKSDIAALFDMSTFHILPRHNEQVVIKLWNELTDRVKIQILTTVVTMTHKNNLYRHIYDRLNIRDIQQGLLAGSSIIKVIPIKYNKDINIDDYRDVYFNRVLYPDDNLTFVYPNIKETGIVGGITNKFYSKYNMAIQAARTNTALTVMMNKLPFSVFIFMRDVLFPKYSEKIYFTEVNNLLYKSLKALLYVHRKGFYHGDFHTGNLVIGETHDLFKLPEFEDGMILAQKYNVNPIDFGESFFFTEHIHILMLIKKNLSEIYGKYVDKIKEKYKTHRDEFVIASTCIDIIEVLTSFRDTIKFIISFHNLVPSDHHKNISKRFKEMINWVVSKYTEYLKSNKSIYDIFAEEQTLLGGDVPKFIENKKIEMEKSVMYAGDYSRLPVYICLKEFFPLNYHL